MKPLGTLMTRASLAAVLLNAVVSPAQSDDEFTQVWSPTLSVRVEFGSDGRRLAPARSALQLDLRARSASPHRRSDDSEALLAPLALPVSVPMLQLAFAHGELATARVLGQELASAPGAANQAGTVTEAATRLGWGWWVAAGVAVGGIALATAGGDDDAPAAPEQVREGCPGASVFAGGIDSCEI